MYKCIPLWLKFDLRYLPKISHMQADQKWPSSILLNWYVITVITHNGLYRQDRSLFSLIYKLFIVLLQWHECCSKSSWQPFHLNHLRARGMFSMLWRQSFFTFVDWQFKRLWMYAEIGGWWWQNFWTQPYRNRGLIWLHTDFSLEFICDLCLRQHMIGIGFSKVSIAFFVMFEHLIFLTWMSQLYEPASWLFRFLRTSHQVSDWCQSRKFHYSLAFESSPWTLEMVWFKIQQAKQDPGSVPIWKDDH